MTRATIDETLERLTGIDDIDDLNERERLDLMASHHHNMEETAEHIRSELRRKFREGEITEEEFTEGMTDFTNEDQLVENLEGVKADKYEKLQEQFLDDEITEDELEQQMDELFDSGDDFLEYEEDTPMLNEGQHTTIRSAKQILGVLLVTTAFVGSIVVTKGISVVAVGVLFILGGIAYARYKGAL